MLNNLHKYYTSPNKFKIHFLTWKSSFKRKNNPNKKKRKENQKGYKKRPIHRPKRTKSKTKIGIRRIISRKEEINKKLDKYEQKKIQYEEAIQNKSEELENYI